MAKWRFYSYDVWGRGYDSWVNDVYKTDVVLDLPDNPEEAKIISAIKQEVGADVTIDSACYTEDVVWLQISVEFMDESDDYHDELEPFGELRKEAG